MIYPYFDLVNRVLDVSERVDVDGREEILKGGGGGEGDEEDRELVKSGGRLKT